MPGTRTDEVAEREVQDAGSKRSAPEAPDPESFGDEPARIARMLSRWSAEHHSNIRRRWAFEWITWYGRVDGPRALAASAYSFHNCSVTPLRRSSR